ncbi:MAG TPA: molybdate ABC transporter substrate-binding protein [Candidatus Limnocylindrales bacterium]
MRPGGAAITMLVVVMSLGACAPSASQEPIEITVFAAASLSNALDAAARAYGDTDAGTAITVSTDSSAALATQIAEGAPADVFLSADTTNPQALVDAGLVDGDAVPFAGNELTIITPTGNPAALDSPFDLATAGTRVIAAGDEVPITKYATRLVENLAADPAAPADFVAAYVANIVSKEDNVSAVRTKIELGEGDAAIVYVTDAAASDTVATIEVPDAANVSATYAAVVVKASAHAPAARAFLGWLTSPDGRAILGDFGFLPPP